MTWVFIFQKRKEKPTYVPNYLNKIKQKINTCYLIHKKSDQIMIEKGYLQIILFFKSTFDILLSHKINLQQN